jgi:hypothetical protein
MMNQMLNLVSNLVSNCNNEKNERDYPREIIHINSWSTLTTPSQRKVIEEVVNVGIYDE